MDWVDKVYCGDSRDALKCLPAESVHLVATSPPYNVGIGYQSYNDSRPHDEYMDMLAAVWQECWRVLVPGGRLCVNVAGSGRNPYIGLPDIIAGGLRASGWSQMGEVIWVKPVSQNDTAWGTWRSPAKPSLRDKHEYVLIFGKGLDGLPFAGEGDITKEEFMEWTRSVWEFRSVGNGSRGNNPCPVPFPPELPTRLIKLYTYPGMVVLDPFAGGGTTCIAARTYGRQFIGIDVDRASCDYAAFALGCDVVDLRTGVAEGDQHG